KAHRGIVRSSSALSIVCFKACPVGSSAFVSALFSKPRLLYSRGMNQRQAALKRVTKETGITLKLNLDGSGKSSIKTGIPFFDHMLTLFARHAAMDLTLRCQGDLEVDAHHTVEDCGIALGQAFVHALGDKKGIRRYGTGF